jgi:hypothetical protein
MVKIGQRWLWDKCNASKFVAEVVDVEPTRVIIKQIFRSFSYKTGDIYQWDPEVDNENEDNSHWTLLNQQHIPQ